MSNRASSVYTIRLDSAAMPREIARHLASVADTGETTVSFRAADDRAAMLIATEAVAAATQDNLGTWFNCELTTGLGVHRRVVSKH